MGKLVFEGVEEAEKRELELKLRVEMVMQTLDNARVPERLRIRKHVCPKHLQRSFKRLYKTDRAKAWATVNESVRKAVLRYLELHLAERPFPISKLEEVANKLKAHPELADAPPPPSAAS